MRLTHVAVLEAPPARVFAALRDPDILKACVAGWEEFEPAGRDTYDLRFRAGSGRLEIRDARPPSSLTLVLEGRSLGGSLRSTAHVRLKEKDGGTELVAEGEARLGGLAALLPSRRVESAAREQISGFFEKLAARLR